VGLSLRSRRVCPLRALLTARAELTATAWSAFRRIPYYVRNVGAFLADDRPSLPAEPTFLAPRPRPCARQFLRNDRPARAAPGHGVRRHPNPERGKEFSRLLRKRPRPGRVGRLEIVIVDSGPPTAPRLRQGRTMHVWKIPPAPSPTASPATGADGGLASTLLFMVRTPIPSETTGSMACSVFCSITPGQSGGCSCGEYSRSDAT
jgi:hypothetical protein